MSKILIVDDDPHIRELIRMCLQKEGFDLLIELGGGLHQCLQDCKTLEKRLPLFQKRDRVTHYAAGAEIVA